MSAALEGRAGFGDRTYDDPSLPEELRRAVAEWTALAGTVAHGGGREEYEVVRRRGRQLASRIADVLGRPVELTDPATGTVESVPVGGAGPRVPHRPTATPWATGLPVAAFAAVAVTLADVVLSRAFADAFGLLWVPANLLVGLGLAPSLYLLRNVALWRWPAMGTAAGLVAAWVVLLLGLLG